MLPTVKYQCKDGLAGVNESLKETDEYMGGNKERMKLIFHKQDAYYYKIQGIQSIQLLCVV